MKLGLNLSLAPRGLLGLIFDLDPTASATIAEAPNNPYVYPLNISRTAALVPVSGTYTGAPGQIEARIVDDAGAAVTGWSAVDTSPTGGTYSGSVLVQAQGLKNLRAEVRAASNPDVTAAQTGLWWTGVKIVANGQSNMRRFFLEGGTPAGVRSLSFGLQFAVEPNGFGYHAEGVTQFIEEWVSLTSTPVMVIAQGVGGATIENLSAAPAITDLQAAITAHATGVLHGLIWNQGEGNANSDTRIAAYPGHLDGIHGLMLVPTLQQKTDVPLILSSLMTTSVADGQQTAAEWAAFKDMQRGLPSNPAVTNIHYAGSTDTMIRLDTYHSYDGSYGQRGRREAWMLAQVLGYVTGDNEFAVSLVTATSGTVTTVNVSHGLGTDFTVHEVDQIPADPVALSDQTSNDLGPAANITGFEVSNDGTTWIAATGTRTDATTITLTHADIAGGERLIRYLYGLQAADIAGAVVDNSTYAMPLIFETSFAEPDVTAPTISNPVGTSAGATLGNYGFDTSESRGTAWVATTMSATPPNAAQIKAGQDHTDTAAVFAASVTVTAASVAGVATGLTEGVTYYNHYYQEDPTGNGSNVLTSASYIPVGVVNLIPRGEFDSPDGWTLPANFSITGGQLIMAGTANFASANTATPTDPANPNTTYELAVDVADITDADNIAIRIAEFTGDSSGFIATQEVITGLSLGVSTVQFTTSATTQFIQLRILGKSFGPHTATLNYVRVYVP